MNTVKHLSPRAGHAGKAQGHARLITTFCTVILLAASSRADGPTWWANRNVEASGFATNDFAGANQGQVKWIATCAKAELDAVVPGGAGRAVAAMVAGFANRGNYCGVNAGQLKNVAKPFWDRLIAIGYTNSYPWPTSGANDFAGVNIGQVKFLFSFDPITMRADIEVTNITLNPVVPAAGQTFSASVTVHNRGNAPGNAGCLYVYTDKATNVALRTAPSKVALAGTLAPNQSTTLEFTGLSAGAEGVKTFRAFADATGITLESIETNNQDTLVYNVSNKADLVISSVTLDPIVPSTGYVFNASVVLKNQGKAPANNFFVSAWSHKTDNAANNTGADGTIAVDALGTNQAVLLCFSNLPAATASTLHTFRIFADSTLAVDEENESNNQVTKLYTPVAHADFTVESISLSPAQPVQGRTYTATVTLANHGAISANAGSLYVYDNKPASVAVGTTPTRSTPVGILPPGTNKVITIVGLVSGEQGNRIFRAFIDATGATVEMNENNNQRALAYTVVRLPDLTIPAITLKPSVPSRGGVFSATVSVKNTGSDVASNVRVSVWPNAPINQTDNTMEAASITIATVATNQTAFVTFSGLDADTSTVARTFRAFANSDLSITESSYSNNQATVTYTPASRPDFTIMQIVLSTTNPPVGSNFTASVWVKNIGYLAGNAGYVDVWTNKDTNVTAAATLVGNSFQIVGILNTNAVKLLTFTGLKAGTDPVPRTFRAIVNSRATTLEVCETNNQDTVIFTPVTAP